MAEEEGDEECSGNDDEDDNEAEGQDEKNEDNCVPSLVRDTTMKETAKVRSDKKYRSTSVRNNR